MRILDYQFVRVTEVESWLAKGYQPYSAPAYDQRMSQFFQAMAKYEAEGPGFTGAANRPAVAATQDLSDVSLDLVDNKVYDIDGNELKIGDFVRHIHESGENVWWTIGKIDPVFSKVTSLEEMEDGDQMVISSVSVRLLAGKPAEG